MSKHYYLPLVLLLLLACDNGIKTVKIKHDEQEPKELMARWELNKDATIPDGWTRANEKEPQWAINLIKPFQDQSILVCDLAQKPEELVSDWDYQDLELKMQFALHEGSSFAFNFYDDYQIILANQIPGTVSGTLTNGKDYTRVPYNGSNRKAVVWQTLKINAKADLQNQLLNVKQIFLNNNLIHQSLKLPLNNQDSWQVKWLPKRGSFALGTIDYITPELVQKRMDKIPLYITDMSYKYYENDGNAWTKLPDFSTLEPQSQGPADVFNIREVRKRSEQYAIEYDGSLKISNDSEVKFWLASDDGSKLWIDNKLIIEHDGTHGPEEKMATLDLKKGAYPLKLHYFQGTGGSALFLYYQIGNGERKLLNSVLETNTNFVPNPDYLLVPGSESYLQRGFVGYPQFLGKASEKKYTHSMAVGNPEGVHYTYDLASGSLLQVWRGSFANTQSMWQNRGIEQMIAPMSETINPAAAYNWQMLSGQRKQWPDSLIYRDNYQFIRYELDNTGKPSFYYTWNDNMVKDQLIPTEEGLKRHIAIDNPPAGLWLALAKGRDIFELEPGLYIISEPGYLLKIEHLEGMNLLLRETDNEKELVASAGLFDLSATVEYEIIF